jgi:hypothetical protein
MHGYRYIHRPVYFLKLKRAFYFPQGYDGVDEGQRRAAFHGA